MTKQRERSLQSVPRLSVENSAAGYQIITASVGSGDGNSSREGQPPGLWKNFLDTQFHGAVRREIQRTFTESRCNVSQISSPAALLLLYSGLHVCAARPSLFSVQGEGKIASAANVCLKFHESARHGRDTTGRSGERASLVDERLR